MRQAGAAGASAGSVAGGLVGSASMALPITGPAIAVASKIGEEIQAGLRDAFKMAGAIASLEPGQLARGFADLAGKVPIVGGLMGTFAHGILDVNDALDQSSRRLARFSPELSMEYARQDVALIMRDMNRAQTMGPEPAVAAQQRFEQQQRLADVQERLLTKLLPILTALMEQLTNAIEFFSEIPNMSNGLANAFTFGLANIARGVDGIEVNTRPAQPGDVDFFNQLFGPLADPRVPDQQNPQFQAPAIPALQGF
jgi:hypothetical protein